MKILVVEDKEMHCKSAEETLQDHELTIINSFEGAMGVMDEEGNFPFDVVLTDMMMPMSREKLASEFFNFGEQVPYGFVIALKAALRGAKFVAMVTDTNHHAGAMSAAIDHLGDCYYRERGFKPNFVVNGAKVMFVHTPFIEEFRKDASCDYCKKNPGACSFCNGTGTLSGYGHSTKCHRCAGHVGKCKFCKGTTKADQTVQERKDWGRVLLDLIS